MKKGLETKSVGQGETARAEALARLGGSLAPLGGISRSLEFSALSPVENFEAHGVFAVVLVDLRGAGEIDAAFGK